MKNKTNRGPGRPMAAIKIPNRKFTFADLCEANEHVTPLTLRKFLNRDMFHPFVKGKNKGKPDKNNPRRNSSIVLTDELVAPDSKEGLGRKAYVYISRAKKNGLKAAAKSRVSVPLNYDAHKANILGTSPTPETQTSTTPSAPAPVAPTVTETASEPIQVTEAAPLAPVAPVPATTEVQEPALA